MSEQDATNEVSSSTKKLAYSVHKGPKVTKLVKGPKVITKYTPSTYLAEMRLTTEQKLDKTYEMHVPKIVELLVTADSSQKDSIVEVDSPLFQPFPSEVFFQQFETHQTYEFPISFRNNDNVARHIKVTIEESPYFKITCNKAVGAKVAPGMEITYHVAFTPDEDKDYTAELTCITEREKFVVPVVATGSRSLLDFPDEVNFSLAPVKYPSCRTVLVRNVGKREAKFTLETESPFSASPTSTSLAPNSCLQVDIGFLPKTVGEHSGTLEIHHDTGEVLYTQLHGTANDINVRLDRASVMHENTYLGLSSKRSVTILNRSDVTVHFVWKAFGSEIDEEMQKELHIQELAEEESFSKESFLQRCVHNPTMRDRYPILVRHLERSKKHYLETEHFHFSSEVFSIDPMEGDIWPNTQAEVTITFSPYKATSYSQVAYCDVTGRESRLPLKLKGEGMGPKMGFSFDTLDIQNIFVNSTHVYEVILENKGDIAGAYTMQPSKTLFGPKFSFVPHAGTLPPGGYQAIQISFSSSVLGQFCEQFLCKVEGSPQDLQLQIKGAVIGPTFRFNVPELRFGDVAYGFQTLQELELTNTSEVLMTFNLSVPGGETAADGKLKEFVVKPRTGSLPPNCRETVTIRLTPSCVKFYSAALVVDIVEAGKEVFSLPITAQSVVPPIILTTPHIDYGRCFVNYPYTKNVELKNDTNLPAIYETLPPADSQSLVYSTTAPKGVIEPHSTLRIPLQIKAQVQGEISSTVVVSILGSSDPPLRAEIYCIGEGPVINATPLELEWGVCPVLTSITKKVVLVNESLIPAEIECVLAQERTAFTVEPFSTVIPPEQRLELTVTAFLDDVLKFTDKLTVVVAQGVSVTINLSAEGKGTTIISYPPLTEYLDLGPHFSKGPCQKQFTLINKGRRVQALSWSTDGFSISKIKRQELEKTAKDAIDPSSKHQFHGQSESIKKPLFEMVPDKLVLEPYQSQIITLKGFSPIPQVVNERLLCHALIGKNPHKERIMAVDVHAQFISPLLEFSTLNLTFVVHQPSGSKLTRHKEVVHAKNVSPLPVTALFSCTHPFSLAADKTSVPQMELRLSTEEEFDIVVYYDATHCFDKHSRVEESQLTVSYKEHPHKDKLTLRSEVHFPNLNFEVMEVDFGCILNDTETTKLLTMTNTSPLEVRYMWSFLKHPPARRVDPDQLDEGVDMQSEIETDSLEEQEEEEEELGEGKMVSEIEGNVPKEDPKEEQVGVDKERAGNEEEVKDRHNEEQSQLEMQQSSETTQPSQDDGAHGIESDPPSTKHTMQKCTSKRKKHKGALEGDPFTPISIEQVFDILPLHGVLQPGESEEVQFTFHGHTGIATEVVAACRVEGGPAYQLRLKGESSLVQYKISKTHIDVGKQLYDQVLTADIVVQNRGKVAMDFTVFGVAQDNDCSKGQIVVSPVMGHISALEQQTLTIRYLPGVPEAFTRSFQIQVAHFEPDTITLTGEGIFPCITFNLPQVKTGVRTQEMSIEGGATDGATDEKKIQLELEMQRLFVKEFALQHPEPSKAKNIRPIIPDFHLDFGHAIYGLAASNVVTLTNIGHTAVSFTTQRSALQNTGFSVDLGDKVKFLPGAPEFESLQFNARFDPAAAKCAEGHVEARLPINLVNGPGYIIKMTAEVARPKMELSSSMIDFGTVLCGQCKVVTIRLHNPYSVKCEWSAITTKPPKQIPKHVPLHLRKKMKEKPPPKYFEVEPSSGILLPDQKKDIQVWFMPSETHHYVETIPFAIKHNAEIDLSLHVEGLGNEPKILFDRPLVEFPPVLPFSSGSEVQVTITNPTSHPVELYSLEFDKQHLEEETILAWLKDRYKLKKLFLPPTAPGGKLPREILDAYTKQQSVANAVGTAAGAVLAPKATSDDTSGDAAPARESTTSVEQSESQLRPPSAPTPSSTNMEQRVGAYETKPAFPSSSAFTPSAVELSVINSLAVLSQATLGTQLSDTETDTNPVTAVIARYLGLDLSPEAALAVNRRGIALIVSGPPQSGRTTQAKALAELYGAAVLKVDEVLIDAISSAATPAGGKAREHCMQTVEITVEEETSPQVAQKKPPTKEIGKEKDLESPSMVDEGPTTFPVNALEGSSFAVPAGVLPYKTLPENVIVDILADRMQHRDCNRGVVVDGVESRFTAGALMTTALVLRALNNRKHIYFVELTMDLPALEARQSELELEKERIEKAEADKRRKAEEREAQRIAELLDLPEDEYESLSEEQRKEIDALRLAAYKEKRRKRQAEEEEHQRLKREKEEEERRLEDEKQKRRGRGGLKDTGKRHSVAGKMGALPQKGSPTGTKEATTPMLSDQLLAGNIPTASRSSLQGAETPTQNSKRKSKKDATVVVQDQISIAAPNLSLSRKYTVFESSVSAIRQLLDDWNRSTGEVRAKSLPEPEEPKATPSKKPKGKPKLSSRSESLEPVCASGQPTEPSIQELDESRVGVGVPLITVNGAQSVKDITGRIMASNLPAPEEILDDMGLGTKGSPIPSPAVFQVHPYSLKRENIDSSHLDQFVFIAASPDDPNCKVEEPVKPSTEPPEDPVQEIPLPQSRPSKRASALAKSTEPSDRRSPQKPTSTAGKRKASLMSNSPIAPAPHEEHQVSTVSDEPAKPSGPTKLVRFRWLIPAQGQTAIRLQFSSLQEGQFDKTLNFEVVGTRQRYQLFCRGICVVPSICREPRIIFPNRKKTIENNEIMHKKYVSSEEAYFFGPLHCGKTRERYREGRYPENMETLTISNTSVIDADVLFCYKNDSSAATFLVEPAQMVLKPGESKTLTIWAYPKTLGSIKDALVCCIKNNPDPVVFNISCDGVEPELKIDKKVLEFKKVLLHRKQTNVLHLHNNTLLPVAWKLSGTEMLGEEFSFSQERGVVQPRSVFPLNVHFRAAKPVAYSKRTFKIEISDVEQIMGLMHVEAVQIQAEAYDVALDVSFPRGADGGLDFQCVKVFDESKLTLHLKNKGKYDIAYNFLNQIIPNVPDCSKMFSIVPNHSTLYPGEKAQAVTIAFRPQAEVVLVDQAILNCQVIDVHVGEQGDVIANIPIKVTARAVFSKFSLCPISDLNFGYMMFGTRKTCTFTLENKGEFEFKYAFVKLLSEQQRQRVANIAAAAAKRVKSREGVASAQSSQVFKAKGKGGNGPSGVSGAAMRTEVMGGSQRLVLGLFTVNSAVGVVPPGQSVVISVECVADKAGKNEEDLGVEISDRHKNDPPITYKIRGEVLIPAINTTDIASIFEEHRICKQLGVLGQHKFHEDGCIGVYGEEDEMFLYKSVIVGQSAKARFKISNPNKIPCDVNILVKSSTTQKVKGAADIFEVEPNKVTILSHSHIYAVVTFRPIAMQLYSATFEAVAEGSQTVKSKGLTFELQGEGNLPQALIEKPVLCNGQGHHLLLFKRLMVGTSQCLPLVVRNVGTIPATVMVAVSSGHESFSIVQPDVEKEEKDEEEKEVDEAEMEEGGKAKAGQSGPGSRKAPPPPTVVKLGVDEAKELSVLFQPTQSDKCNGELQLKIQDNQFENLRTVLVGEGYKDDVAIDNIQSVMEEGVSGEEETVNTMQAYNHLQFGGCPVGETKQVSFVLSNHSTVQTIRFLFPSLTGVSFSPSIGHLHPNSSKDIVVTFKPVKAQAMNAQKAYAKICKIGFSNELIQVPDWDDRMKSVRWVTAPTQNHPGTHDTPPTPPGRPPPTPAKQKVIETEPEPPHTVVDGSHRDLELTLSGVAGYTKYECSTSEVKFRDTLMFQTRVFSFSVKNTGPIPLPYKWTTQDQNESMITNQKPLTKDTGSTSSVKEVLPFSVNPASGIIPFGQEANFTIRFSPLDLVDMECIFRCNIPNLDQSCRPLDLKVQGVSLMPYCHFELEENNYLTLRQAEARGGLGTRTGPIIDSATRVIEFHSRGIGVKNHKEFNIINPTSSGYEFTWTPDNSSISVFKCLMPRGYIAGGKKHEIAFDFIPTTLDLIESLWTFSIPSLSISVPFLLVGQAVEPAVNMDRAYVNFRSMFVGTQSQETVYLLNDESAPYHFAFTEQSCQFDGHSARVLVEPMAGIIQPKTKLPIQIQFTATQEREYSFNLLCQVKRKLKPLILNVKAQGYAINTAITCKGPDGKETELQLDKAAKRVIDFKQVHVNEKSLWEICVHNHGLYSFEYKWKLSEKCLMPGGEGDQVVVVQPEEGVVPAHDKVRCSLVFSPAGKVSLKGSNLTLCITNGPSIVRPDILIALKGQGVEPLLHFSFMEYNFGHSFLYRLDMALNKTILIITNKDTKDISLNCLYTSKHAVEVDFEPKLLTPGESCEALVVFKPREAIKYCEEVPFEINGLLKKTVVIRGEGTQTKIELVNPAQRTINFGALRVNQTASRKVKLINRSPIPVVFSVSIVPSSSVAALQVDGVLTVTPSGDLSLQPNAIKEIEITFSPKSRVTQFSEEVTLECQGFPQPLLIMTGSCQGLEISLDTEHVPFGAVVLKSQSERRVLMHNSGDIGARFRWDVEKFAPDFTITPVEGYITPGMEVTFDIAFHPAAINPDIRYESIPCYIEDAKPLQLTLTGMCIEQVPLKDVIHFFTSVRGKEVRQLTISNKTNSTWLLKPIIDGEYWSGPESITIPPNQNHHYELTYQPLVMTPEPTKHQGSIFFPLPDGSGLLYNLLGTAEPPKQAGSIQQEIPCKTHHTELLAVKNWLKRPQRFKVIREIIKPEKLDRSVLLDGMDYIDVPALSKRDYKLKFYSFKECSISAKVTFRNEQTGEYLFYIVQIKFVPSGVIGTIELKTQVRKSVSHMLTIDNPLPAPVTVTTSINVPDISLPSSFILGAQSMGNCTFEFLPLRPGDSTGKLTLSSSELGVYQYELHLVATPPAPERAVHFTTNLGGSHQQLCRFVSYAKGRTEYSCKIDSNDFHVEKSINVASAGSSGTEASIEVTFEPSHLGDTQAILSISSPTGGDYTIPLNGHCLVPKPQGPFVIKAGATTSISFKNIFGQVMQFNFSVDNPAFTLKATSESIKPRKTYNIAITYDTKQADSNTAKVGKLVVTSQGSARSSGGISWTYYLKGVPHS